MARLGRARPPAPHILAGTPAPQPAASPSGNTTPLVIEARRRVRSFRPLRLPGQTVPFPVVSTTGPGYPQVLSRAAQRRPLIHFAPIVLPGMLAPQPVAGFGRARVISKIARDRAHRPVVSHSVVETGRAVPPAVGGSGRARVVSKMARDRAIRPIVLRPLTIAGQAGLPRPKAGFGKAKVISHVARYRMAPVIHFHPIVLPGMPGLAPVPASNNAIPVLNPLEMSIVATPLASPTGTLRVYPKADSSTNGVSFYGITASGVEELIGPTPIPVTGAPNTPIIMSANLVLPAETQMLFRTPITIGPYQIILGAGAQLVGV